MQNCRVVFLCIHTSTSCVHIKKACMRACAHFLIESSSSYASPQSNLMKMYVFTRKMHLHIPRCDIRTCSFQTIYTVHISMFGFFFSSHFSSFYFHLFFVLFCFVQFHHCRHIIVRCTCVKQFYEINNKSTTIMESIEIESFHIRSNKINMIEILQQISYSNEKRRKKNTQ